jgi:hypothetical protein
VPFDVSVEKLIGVVFEDAISEQTVVRSGETAAGNRRDYIDLVERAKLAPFPTNVRLGQHLENTIRKRRGAGTSPRERKPDKQGIRTSPARRGLRWSGADCTGWRVRLVDAIVRCAAYQQPAQDTQRQQIKFFHNHIPQSEVARLPVLGILSTVE